MLRRISFLKSFTKGRRVAVGIIKRAEERITPTSLLISTIAIPVNVKMNSSSLNVFIPEISADV